MTTNITQELLNSIRKTPPVNFDPFPQYGHEHLPFAMSAGLEATLGGRLWTCWIGGEDGEKAYMLASYSDDGGKSWRDPVFVIDPRGNSPIPESIPMGSRTGSFWCDPLGRLWLFFKQALAGYDGSCSNWFIRCDDPDSETPTWSEPCYISFGVCLNKAIVRKNGEGILPVSLWERWHISEPFCDCYHELDHVRGANVFVSDNEGGHWRYRGGMAFEDSCFNEHSVVELRDGRLWMLARCHKEIAQSFSDDGGFTWQTQQTAFPHVNGKCVVRRLHSGNILLVKHGTDMNTATSDRTHMTAFLSTDDTKTWSRAFLLDERGDVSYPDIAQAPNGDIYVYYDYNRATDAAILFAKFRDEDVIEGKAVTEHASLKNIIKDKNGMSQGTD